MKSKDFIAALRAQDMALLETIRSDVKAFPDFPGTVTESRIHGIEAQLDDIMTRLRNDPSLTLPEARQDASAVLQRTGFEHVIVMKAARAGIITREEEDVLRTGLNAIGEQMAKNYKPQLNHDLDRALISAATVGGKGPEGNLNTAVPAGP